MQLVLTCCSSVTAAVAVAAGSAGSTTTRIKDVAHVEYLSAWCLGGHLKVGATAGKRSRGPYNTAAILTAVAKHSTTCMQYCPGGC
eukprot:17803-Heterococcus_DN1.PRE.1